VDIGLEVILNNVTLSVSNSSIHIGGYTISLYNQFEFLLESNDFNIRIANSDYFLNQDVTIGSDLMHQISEYKRAIKQHTAGGKELLPHGLLGQTWDNIIYQTRWKYIEGHIFDYVVVDGITGTDFKYNRFQF